MENKIYFGIDCDPFVRHQEDFQKEAEAVLGREIKATSKFFGCWEYEEEMSSEQHKKICDILVDYYQRGDCRGIACDDIKKLRPELF